MRQVFKKYFYIKNFGNSVAETKLRAEAGHYLLFHIVHAAIKRANFPNICHRSFKQTRM